MISWIADAIPTKNTYYCGAQGGTLVTLASWETGRRTIRGCELPGLVVGALTCHDPVTKILFERVEELTQQTHPFYTSVRTRVQISAAT